MALRRLACAAVLVLIASCGEEPPPASPGWVRFEVPGAFSFLAPADLQIQPSAPLDSRSGRWRSAELEVFYDLGWYSDPLMDGSWARARRSETEIDGRAALLVTLEHALYDDGLDHVAALHVVGVGGSRDRLTLVVRGAAPADLARAEAILRSVSFLPAPDRRP